MIYGNASQQLQLQQALDSRVRSLCLTGPPHLGKATLLAEVVSLLAADVDIFAAETGIESARESVSFCRHEPLEGDTRFVLVDDAHKMADGSQDAYLKLLEEPPERGCIVFVVPDGGYLAPALVSRFRSIIRFEPLSPSEMRECIANFGEVDEVLESLCLGRPGLYKSMLGEARYKGLFQTLQKGLAGEADLLMEEVPSILSDSKEPIQRESIAHICRMAGRLSAAAPKRRLWAYKYGAVLLSSPSCNAEIHWSRMAAHLSLSM